MSNFSKAPHREFASAVLGTDIYDDQLQTLKLTLAHTGPNWKRIETKLNDLEKHHEHYYPSDIRLHIETICKQWSNSLDH